MIRAIPFMVLMLSLAHAEDWRFLVVADWHSAEKYVQLKDAPDRSQEYAASDVDKIGTVHRLFGGEFVVMPGDSNRGHWDTKPFIQSFKPGASPAESILAAGAQCYGGMLKSWRAGGYDLILMAVGDHEVGDNPWPKGSAVSRCQPQFRQAFADAFNATADGAFRFADPIGSVPSRPLGTPYERTSFAYRHRNVLFVTVDAFHQESPDTVIGGEGTVTGTVTGPHLEWFDRVLAAGRAEGEIDHIVVQTHLPVIHPVRKVQSSGMLMDAGTGNAFWQCMRRHGVDLYLAGEVHADTVTRDPESDLVQLVSRGNGLTGLLTVDVSADGLSITRQHREQDGESIDYRPIGSLNIDKSQTPTRIEGEGILAPIDPRERILHYDFEEQRSLAKEPLYGLRLPANGSGGWARVKGRILDRYFPDTGAFGLDYSALFADVQQVDGVVGKAAAFNDRSLMCLFGMGPHHSRYGVTYACWVRSSAKGKQILISSTTIWRNPNTGFFDLRIDDGRPQIAISTKQMVTAESRINDGEWHHVAAVLPAASNLSDVLLYVDGELVSSQLTGGDRPVHIEQSFRLSIGGFGTGKATYKEHGAQAFVGALDELGVWARGLDPDEVAALADRGSNGE